jgi:hypothetical protein
VTIDVPNENGWLIIYLDLPADCKPPFKAVIYWPSVNALVQPAFSRNPLWEPWDMLPKNGGALIIPIYANCFERGRGKPVTGKKTVVQRWFIRLNELRRTIDYLETRDDIDICDLAFLGVCWGDRRTQNYSLRGSHQDAGPCLRGHLSPDGVAKTRCPGATAHRHSGPDAQWEI